jgi:hypothetical protein
MPSSTSSSLTAHRIWITTKLLKKSINARLKGYCHFQLTIATPHTTISPLIKTAVKFTILSGNFAAWVK